MTKPREKTCEELQAEIEDRKKKTPQTIEEYNAELELTQKKIRQQ